MYPESINADHIEEIGTLNVQAFKKTAEYDVTKPNKSILGALLKGRAEEKALVRLNS